MPLMDLTYPAGTLATDARDALVDELTTILLRAERAPNTDFFRSIAWVNVHELGGGSFLAAGRPVDQPAFRLQVTIPDGALDDRRKQEFVENATSAIAETAGLEGADLMRIWVIFNEVPDGNWAAGGHIVRFEQLRKAAAAEQEKAGAGAAAVVA